MQPIQKEYLILFNVITDANKALRELEDKLKNAQQMAEEIYISKQDIVSGKSPCLRQTDSMLP